MTAGTTFERTASCRSTSAIRKEMGMRTLLALFAAGVLGGCATSYQLSLMPRDSGKIYSGVADDTSGGEGKISITIESKIYNGTWVQSVPERSSGFVAGGGFGWGRWGRGAGMGTLITYD